MSWRIGSSQEKAQAEGLRVRGYNHALAGKEKTSSEPTYMEGYRRGAARRELLRSGGKEAD